MDQVASARARTSLVAVDQVVSAASNILIGLVAAHVLGIGAFGLFTLLLFTYAFLLAFPSGLISQAFLVHPEDADTRAGEGVGSTLMVGTLVAVPCLVTGLIGVIVGWDLGWPFVLLAAGLPLMALQDFGRFLSFAARHPARAVVLDVAWLVLELGAIAVTDHFHATNLTTFSACWIGSGAIAGLLVLTQTHAHRPVWNSRWLRDRWAYSWRSALVSTITLGSVVLGSFGLLAVASAAVVGAVRGALLLVRPFQILQQAFTAAATTDIARDRPEGGGLDRAVRGLTVRVGALAGVNLLVLIVIPDSLGRLGLGSAWPVVAPLMGVAALQVLANGLTSGPRAAMLGWRVIGVSMRLDIAAVLLTVTLMLSGSVLADAEGAMWGAAIANLIALPVYWLVYLRVRSRLNVGSLDAGGQSRGGRHRR